MTLDFKLTFEFMREYWKLYINADFLLGLGIIH
jgi:hypothetical protein